MEKVFYFSSKTMRIFRIITLILLSASIALLLIFAFNIWCLVSFCVILPLFAFALLTLNRSKIVIKGDRLILVNIWTKCWDKKEIKSIICNRYIEIQTDQKTFRSPGYLSLKWPNTDKNEQLVKELNQWLQEK